MGDALVGDVPPQIDDFFWSDLLDYVDDGRVIPVVDSAQFATGPGGETLETLTARRLAQRLRIDLPDLPRAPRLDDVVVRHQRAAGSRGVLYGAVEWQARDLKVGDDTVSRTCTAIDREDQRLMLGSERDTAVIDLAGSKTERVPLGGVALVRSSDCQLAVVRNDLDGRPRFELRDGATGRIVGILGRPESGRDDSMPFRFMFEPQGQLLAALAEEEILLWRTSDSGQPAARFERRRGATIVGVASSPDKHWGAVVLGSGEVLLKDLTVKPQSGGHQNFRLPTVPVGLFFAADSENATVVDAAGTLFSVRLHPRRPLRALGKASALDTIEFNASGTFLGGFLGPDGGRKFALWKADAEAGAADVLPLAIVTAEFSPKDRFLAVKLSDTSAGPKVKVLDLARGNAEHAEIVFEEGRNVEALSISPAEDVLAVVLDEGVLLFDLVRKKRRNLLAIGSPPIWAAFHPQLPLLATAHRDGVVRVWSTNDGKPLGRKMDGKHTGEATVAAFAPRGDLLLSGGDDGTVIVRKFPDGSSLGTLQPQRQTRAEKIENLVFLDGGTILAAGSWGGAKYLYDLDRRVPLGMVGGGGASSGDLQGVAISPTARRLALKHSDSTITMHRWDPESLTRDACTIAGRNLECDEWRQAFASEPYRKTCPALPLPPPDKQCR